MISERMKVINKQKIAERRANSTDKEKEKELWVSNFAINRYMLLLSTNIFLLTFQSCTVQPFSSICFLIGCHLVLKEHLKPFSHISQPVHGDNQCVIGIIVYPWP